MAGGQGAFDTGGPLAFARIESTEVKDGVVLAAVRVSEDDGGAGEEVYGGLGDGGRPLPLDSDGGTAEAVCVRAASGDLPVLGIRELRIETGRAAPPGEGTIYKAGYYGAELRFDVVDGEARSTVTVTDNAGRDLVLDDQGVRVPSSPLIQGDPGAAKDVALAGPLVDLVGALYTVVASLATAVNSLAGPGTIDISNLTTKAAPYLAPGSPAAPTTRAPDLRGAPGA